MKEYREPEAKFISLNPAEKVADTCWAYANNGKSPLLYYNLEGLGSLEFKVAKGNDGCDGGKPDEETVYYVIDSDKNGYISDGERIRRATTDEILRLTEAVQKVGGNSGENFQGGDFSEYVPSDWS